MNTRGRVGNNGDRITNLHDSVTRHIMSRLPTKDAVRTSILSKAWENKWKCLYNVDVEEKYELRSYQDFGKFMDKIHCSTENLKSFRLTSWNYKNLRNLRKWISGALKSDSIECFEVSLSASGIVYPNGVLNSTSLRKVSLMQQTGTLYVAAMNYAPNLTSLNLSLIEIVNEDPNSSTVKFNFPVLKTFTAVATKWLKLKSVEIHAPALTEFTSKPEGEGRVYDYTITIVAHRITKFTLSYGLPENIVLDGSSIVSATLHSRSVCRDTQLHQAIGSQVSNLINGFTNVEELELSSYMAVVSQLGSPIRTFDKLIRLSVLSCVRMKQLFDLLHSARSLKFLTLYTIDLKNYDYGTMMYLPSCVVSELVEVVLRDFDCQVPAYNLAKFLLRSTNQLKKFIIVGSYHRREEIENVLSTFARASTRVTIEVRRT